MLVLKVVLCSSAIPGMQCPISAAKGGSHALVDAIGFYQAMVNGNGDIATAVEDYYSVAFKRCQEAVKR